MLINEKKQIFSLYDFLREVIEYCAEYYHELNLKIEIDTKDCKDFSFKRVALAESIFAILTIITRIGKFDIYNQALIIKASFINNNLFPTIAIEAPLYESPPQSKDWLLGDHYTYSGLLPIYLLAKENNLFLRLEQKEQKIIFILEPIDIESLENIDNCLPSPI